LEQATVRYYRPLSVGTGHCQVLRATVKYYRPLSVGTGHCQLEQATVRYYRPLSGTTDHCQLEQATVRYYRIPNIFRRTTESLSVLTQNKSSSYSEHMI